MIKNYIFDFGDVFINLDKQAPKRELQNFGMTEFTEEMITINNLYEKGLVSTDKFLSFYQKQFPNITKTTLIRIWNKMLLDFPTYRLTFIEQFSKNNRCFLLSNINDLHLEYIKKQLGNNFYNRFYNCFKKVYYSHEINLRKPDSSIYEYFLKDSQLSANECFFIDDKPENTKTATELGIQCWNLNPEKDDIIELSEVLTVL